MACKGWVLGVLVGIVRTQAGTKSFAISSCSGWSNSQDWGLTKGLNDLRPA